MRRLFIVISFFIVISAIPAVAVTKTTVAQLEALLSDLHSQSKSDQATSDKLKDLQLTEQISASAMNSFVQYQPGPLTIVQIRVLALEGALLPPPAAELPSAPAPDTATQSAIIGRAIDYTAKQFSNLPTFTAEKLTSRFQEGDDAVRVMTGAGSTMSSANLTVNPATHYIHFLGQHTSPILSERGVELPPAKVKGKDAPAQGGPVSQGGAGPILGIILMDAAHGKISWSRWQSIDGNQVAVFAYSVDRKQSHYQVNYCCFPRDENVGSHIGASIGGSAGGGNSANSSNYGTATSLEPFKASVGYHGEFFIDPASGTLVRLTTQAELKNTDLVRQEDTRIDYAPVNVAGKQYTVPTHSTVLTEVVTSGNSFSKFSTRHNLFDIEYKNYQPGTASTAK